MLTGSTVFLLNLCNEYRDIQRAKVASGVVRAWLKQDKATTSLQRRRRITEDSDDSDNNATAPGAPSSAASKPTVQRNVSLTPVLPSLPMHKLFPRKNYARSRHQKRFGDKEPMDILTSCHYGGLEDEDDNEEWETIKQSPIKEQGVRVGVLDVVILEMLIDSLEDGVSNGVS